MVNIGEELPQILLDIRSSQVVNWKSAVILYDNTFGMTKTRCVVIAKPIRGQVLKKCVNE